MGYQSFSHYYKLTELDSPPSHKLEDKEKNEKCRKINDKVNFQNCSVQNIV